MRRSINLLLALVLCVPFFLGAGMQDDVKQDEKKAEEQTKLNPGTFAGLSFRNIGPALMSGRIGDIAIDPTDESLWYVAVASGNVFKTTNAGTTWTPIFDSYGSYSIGCLTIDPRNRHTLWLGTGENNSQRSVGYGDGIYKSLDGGKSWTNMGLKNSEHIGRILVDPRNSDTVYVAAQGPLWAPGGDRGLYKTTDGGRTWNLALQISENTGVTEVLQDPRNPDVLYAAAYQRRRHVWTLINGGPESAVYKSTDAGATWRKIMKGLPGGDVGRIGMVMSPQNPEVIYAIIEAAGENSGFFRTENGGETWAKMSSYVSGSPQYYNEIVADPFVFDRVYSLDTYLMVSDDGGRNFRPAGEAWKHVDNHAMAFVRTDPNYFLIGCDGGLYETWDRGANYKYVANLPVTQFYKICVDNALPFYNIYGGTQDNNTQGGPSRTNNVHGIRNEDWFITVGGDGFQPRVDPTDPNTVYSEWQHGGLVRFDRRTGEGVDIQPQTEPGEDAPRWNWDSPLIISPHSNTRLYFGSQRLYRSDDRGDTWTPISPDLTRKVDRNKMEVMGKVWSVDAVAKNRSTSFYGNLVSLTESPKVAGLVYAGSDDGVIAVTEDGGATWNRIEMFPGVPEMTYVAYLTASEHDANTVFAVFNNHKRGDFKPYVLKSTDRGKSWTSITGNLPDRHVTWCIQQDHVRPELLFVGTEFGVFFSIDGGAKWIQFKGGLPTIAIRDIAIQRRENDLVLGSFGRGFFVLDNYSPLQQISAELLEKEATLFPAKKTLMYMERDPLGGGQKAFQGEAYYTAPNPPFGATFTFYLKDSSKTRKQVRQEAEAKLAKENKPVFYPPWEDLKAEDREEAPSLVITIADETGAVIRQINEAATAGIHRVTWNLRYPGSTPVGVASGRRFGGGGGESNGPYVMPGTYTVSIARKVDGVLTPLAGPLTFECVPMGIEGLTEIDRAANLAFQKQTARLQRAVMGANAAAAEADTRITHLRTAIAQTPGIDPAHADEARQLAMRLRDLREQLTGDPTLDRRSEATPPSLLDRLNRVVGGHWSVSTAATATWKRQYEIVADSFGPLLENLRQLIDVDLKALEAKVEAAGAPWTPGRAVPVWNK